MTKFSAYFTPAGGGEPIKAACFHLTREAIMEDVVDPPIEIAPGYFVAAPPSDWKQEDIVGIKTSMEATFTAEPAAGEYVMSFEGPAPVEGLNGATVSLIPTGWRDGEAICLVSMERLPEK